MIDIFLNLIVVYQWNGIVRRIPRADLKSVEHERQLKVVKKVQHHMHDQETGGEQRHERVAPTHM